jgi:hypothetical protein
VWTNRVFRDVTLRGQIVSFEILHCVDKSCLSGRNTPWTNRVFWDVTLWTNRVFLDVALCGQIVSFGL